MSVGPSQSNGVFLAIYGGGAGDGNQWRFTFSLDRYVFRHKCATVVDVGLGIVFHIVDGNVRGNT